MNLINKKGAFQTSRDIFDNDIWIDIIKFRIFFYIYGKAVHAEQGKTVAGIRLERGEYLTSYRNLRDDLAFKDKRSIQKYSLNTIKSKIEELITEKRLTAIPVAIGTVFKVTNYALYQGLDNYKKDFAERQQNDSRTPTERQQNNKKNEKNEKNEKNIYSPEIPFEEIVVYLNKRANANYRHTSKKTRDVIQARYNEGFNLDDFKYVIDVKTEEWFYDDKWEKYLRPETLFGTKFESYRNQPFKNKNIQPQSRLEGGIEL